MANEADRRIGWPLLAALLAFFAGSAYFVFLVSENAVESSEASGLIPGAPEDEVPGPDPRGRRASTRDGGTATRGPGAADPTGRDRFYDPQSWSMLRSFDIASLDASIGLPFDPVELPALITERSGAVPVEPGAACALRVLPVRGDEYNCLVRVLCGGRVLYPNQSQTAGYVRCAITEGSLQTAEDRDHSALDGDPLIRFDLRLGTATVEDRGDGVEPFAVTFRLGR